MITAFYILLFLAIWHFFYESILASSFRHGLRYKFFELRDRLRNIKIDNSLSKKDEQIYEILDNSICHMIDSMSFISVGNYLKLKKEIDRNIKIKSKIENTKDYIETADNEQLKNINYEIGKIGSRALVINNGGWLIYCVVLVIPVLVIIFFKAQLDKLLSKINKISTRLIYSTETVQIA